MAGNSANYFYFSLRRCTSFKHFCFIIAVRIAEPSSHRNNPKYRLVHNLAVSFEYCIHFGYCPTAGIRHGEFQI